MKGWREECEIFSAGWTVPHEAKFEDFHDYIREFLVTGLFLEDKGDFVDDVLDQNALEVAWLHA